MESTYNSVITIFVLFIELFKIKFKSVCKYCNISSCLEENSLVQSRRIIKVESTYNSVITIFVLVTELLKIKFKLVFKYSYCNISSCSNITFISNKLYYLGLLSKALGIISTAAACCCFHLNGNQTAL